MTLRDVLMQLMDELNIPLYVKRIILGAIPKQYLTMDVWMNSVAITKCKVSVIGGHVFIDTEPNE